MMQRFFILLIGFCFTQLIFAANTPSPFGKWVTISDKNGERTGVVELYEKNGTLNGKIVKIFPGGNRNPNDRCTKCPAEFKNKPLQDLTFLWGFKPQSNNSWSNGKILDPKEGKIYHGKIKISENGRKLSLRGYWGVFWRTQTWLRE